VNCFAGNVEGNGGNVFYCPGEVGKDQVIFFDYFEGIDRGFSYQLIENKTEEVVIDIILNRIKKFDKKRYQKYLSLLENFNSQVEFKSGALRYTNDAFQVFIPEGCSFEQLVVQRTPYFKEDRRYNISKKFWGKLEEFQKALVKLHEVFYSEIVDARAIDSTGVRYFLENIASDKAESFDSQDYANLVSKCDNYNTIRNVE
jgi:hypothetical protein